MFNRSGCKNSESITEDGKKYYSKKWQEIL